MQSLSEIRSSFLDFFRARGHEVVPSSPLVPRNDPTLLFTNAGMVQFKNVFTGQEKRPYSRATTAQKCVRAGGKHNDLENVGYTARHLTFFEMLGNFSFGDYFKEAAIGYAWELVHKVFALPAERLLVTVFAEDDDAFLLWKKIAGLPESKIIRIPTADNFWSMGDTGPCGPCSEIFFDHGPAIAGGPPGSAEQDGDRFVEIWNLVFMQFEQFAGGKREALPRPSIDTGMGLERFATVMQGVHDVFDVDLFRHIIAASAELTGQSAAGAHAASHRVIADHLRSSAFLIADGVLPSNEGRGYVLRRIMRRAMRHAHLLGSRDPLLYRLLPALVAEMGSAYPELKRAEALTSETLRLEELRFRETLARGLKLLEEATQTMSRGDRLSGETAFRLYDTYGFPLDLTEDALRPRGIAVDTAGFNAAMARQREEARKAWAGSGETGTDALWFALKDEIGATEFLGYDTEEAEGTIVAMLKDGARVERAAAGETVRILTNQTPFYGEAGGQVGDAGAMFSAKGAEARVLDTEKKLGSLNVHLVEMMRGTLGVGDVVELRVDGERRRATRANHSATHLLHAALKHVLGPHVSQKGSLVAPDRLRFDFSHPKALSPDELERVENEVNAVIRQNSDVATRLMPTADAIAAGAEALFGEKYGDEVRVLTMGETDARPYSVELCGGTHVRRLGDIGLFTILSESAVAAGVRRIEALTSEGARRYLSDQAEIAREAAAALKTNPAELRERVVQLAEERRRIERELAEARRALALAGPARSDAKQETREIAGVKTMLRVVEGVSAKDLKGLVDDAKARIGSGVVALVAVADGRASLVVGVTDDLKSRIDSVDLVRRAAETLGGKGGGGRADLAQAGGPDGSKAEEALATIERRLADLAPVN
ncbi:MAG TPA: alanine--tRNA ligase [Rhizomicrobium sp.]|jgi:alanyl-tRNA synthetase|nr:alanine--tRNA ligase [Rhizomicrobium sp.]